MSPEWGDEPAIPYRFPRVSGDEPHLFKVGIWSQPFSPRERG